MVSDNNLSWGLYRNINRYNENSSTDRISPDQNNNDRRQSGLTRHITGDYFPSYEHRQRALENRQNLEDVSSDDERDFNSYPIIDTQRLGTEEDQGVGRSSLFNLQRSVTISADNRRIEDRDLPIEVQRYLGVGNVNYINEEIHSDNLINSAYNDELPPLNSIPRLIRQSAIYDGNIIVDINEQVSSDDETDQDE